jgi:hypothetical protein
VRGEWFSGEAAELVLLLVDGLTRTMVELYDGSDVPPSVWSILPPPTVDWDDDGTYFVLDSMPEWALTDEQREMREAADKEAGIGPLSEVHWPKLSNMFMDGTPLEAIAHEFGLSQGRLERTMEAMRRGGYALDPRTRRVRDPYGHESSRRWIRAS